jgi:ATP-dependent RNA helicase SUPV3L1/SUV3
MSGYHRAGSRAIRSDLLEGLADLLWLVDRRAGFEAKADMLSITGMTLDQFAALMGGLGYTAEKGERVKVKPAEKPREATAEEIHAEAERRAAAEAAALAAEIAAAQAAEAAAGEVAPEAEAVAEAGPEMEAFYTFTWRPKPRERAPRPERRPEGQQAKPQGERSGGAKRRDGPPDGNRRRDQGGKPKGKGKRDDDRATAKSFEARPPRRDKPIDPDSPFAVLAALKGKQ